MPVEVALLAADGSTLAPARVLELTEAEQNAREADAREEKLRKRKDEKRKNNVGGRPTL